ncbi:MAG: MASE1 domain-containing protein [Stellaceae bacterium]
MAQMTETPLGRTIGAPARHLPALAPVLLALGYTALYLLLDRATFFQSLHGIDITPWNPQPGLTLALLIVKGWNWLPVVILADLLATRLVPAVFVPLTVAIPSVLLSAAAYGIGAAVFRRYTEGWHLERARDVIWVTATAIVASAVVTFGFVGIYTAAGLIPRADFFIASVQLWIGNAIGAMVLTPLALVVAQGGRPGHLVLGRDWIARVETAGQWGGIAVALFLVFGVGNANSFERFYFLFLPLVWIAVRRGLGAACWAVLAIQAGLIAALEFEDKSAATVLNFQMLMFAVATTGQMLGAVVSERGRALRALARSEKRLAGILDAASDAVLMIDSRGHIESANPAVERLFGHEPASAVGRDVHELIGAPQPLQHLAAQIPASAVDAVPWQFQGVRADGTPFPIEVTAGHFGTSDAHYTLVVRDVTQRRNAEMRMRLHESEVAQGSRFALADEMATAMAHEMNQPLTAITTFARGCLRMIRERDPNKAMLREGIEHMVEQAERAGDIIERLRDLARGATAEPRPTDVKVMLDAAVALVETEATRKRVEILFAVLADPPPVMADRIEIEQVLVNLLRNGIDAAAASASERKSR